MPVETAKDAAGDNGKAVPNRSNLSGGFGATWPEAQGANALVAQEMRSVSLPRNQWTRDAPLALHLARIVGESQSKTQHDGSLSKAMQKSTKAAFSPHLQLVRCAHGQSSSSCLWLGAPVRALPRQHPAELQPRGKKNKQKKREVPEGIGGLLEKTDGTGSEKGHLRLQACPHSLTHE